MTSTNKIILVTFALAGASCIAVFSLHNQAQSQQSQTRPGNASSGSETTPSPGGVVNGSSPDYPGAAGGSDVGDMTGEPGVSGAGNPGSAGMDGQAPGGSSPGYAGSAGSDGAPGSAPGTDNPDSPVSSGDTVSVNATGNDHEWTQEEMLLARPMPMSQEERDFVFAHKAPETIKTWSAQDFDQYVNDPIGAQQIFSEGQRWIELRKMLLIQVKAGKQLLYGQKKFKADNILAAEPQNEVFIKELSDLKRNNHAEMLQKMQQCRSDITTLCNQINALQATAKKRGKQALLEQAISNAQP